MLAAAWLVPLVSADQEIMLLPTLARSVILLGVDGEPSRRIFEGAEMGNQAALQFHQVDPLDQPLLVGGVGEHRAIFEAVRVPSGEASLHIDLESRKTVKAPPVEGRDCLTAAETSLWRDDLGIG